MRDRVVYEQPLSERVRVLLRLEFLFEQAGHHLQRPSGWDARATFSTLLDILALLGRSDLKSELLKELERHVSYVERFRETPGVDPAKLDEVARRLEALNRALYGSGEPFGQSLKGNDFLNALRQRSAIPGGMCAFDIPALHHWLQRPPETRLEQLQAWFARLEPLSETTALLLRVLRESAAPRARVAAGGLYQQGLDPSTPVQLVRAALPREASCFAEISGGRHRLTVRFRAQPDLETRPAPVREDVAFELTCCAI